MRIEITNGFVEIRDAMNRKARNAYQEAFFFGVNVRPEDLNKPPEEFPIINLKRAQDALTTNLVKRVVIDGLEVPNALRYMEEEMSEADYDKVALACQKLDTPAIEIEKKTKSSTNTGAGNAAPLTESPTE